MRKFQTSVAMFSIGILMLACEREWHFSITRMGNGFVPVFCVSEDKACSGKGIQLGVFAVYEVPGVPPSDIARKQSHTAWEIVPTSNEPLREFAYGKAPKGWKETIKAEQLEEGKIYSVGPYWFRISKRNGKVEYEVAPMGRLK